MIGDRNSYVFGSILDGVFEGKIITERDAYYVEHAKHYFPTNFTQSQMQSGELHSTDTNSSSPATIDITTSTSTTTTTTTTTTSTTSTTENPNSSKSSSKPKSITDHHDDAVKNVGFHSVIYKESHVDDAYKDVREGKLMLSDFFSDVFIMNF